MQTRPSRKSKVYNFVIYVLLHIKGRIEEAGACLGLSESGQYVGADLWRFLFLKECYHKRFYIREIMESKIHCPSFEDF